MVVRWASGSAVIGDIQFMATVHCTQLYVDRMHCSRPYRYRCVDRCVDLSSVRLRNIAIAKRLMPPPVWLKTYCVVVEQQR